MRVVFVLFHKEIGSTKETGIVKYICVCCKPLKKWKPSFSVGFFSLKEIELK